APQSATCRTMISLWLSTGLICNHDVSPAPALIITQARAGFSQGTFKREELSAAYRSSVDSPNRQIMATFNRGNTSPNRTRN
ncbi:hypothetical protein, partial [Acinetobacter sp. ULE_I037]|uniref:hypothetical protein n=1 Tax=Acinetobacter sp. ULE_I037 TaxID=3373067 RepID=UPI003AF869EC